MIAIPDRYLVDTLSIRCLADTISEGEALGRTISYEMNGLKFEYDEDKSLLNMTNFTNRLPFSEAYKVWEQPFGEILKPELREDAEARFVRRGYIGASIWFCVYTPRNEAFRIISLRPAGEKERNLP